MPEEGRRSKRSVINRHRKGEEFASWLLSLHKAKIQVERCIFLSIYLSVNLSVYIQYILICNPNIYPNRDNPIHRFVYMCQEN